VLVPVDICATTGPLALDTTTALFPVESSYVLVENVLVDVVDLYEYDVVDPDIVVTETVFLSDIIVAVPPSGPYKTTFVFVLVDEVLLLVIPSTTLPIIGYKIILINKIENKNT
tara:strand:+ start:2917 stop:3258 length:342 start_codon:yes stop_codon:yes gene_type:complete